MLLTSRQNPLCKLIRSLHSAKGRRESGLFLVEGKNAVEAAIKSDWPLQKILFEENAADLWQTQNPQVEFQAATAELLAYLSDAETSPGVMALAKLPDSHVTIDEGLVLFLNGIGDPGNIGTLIRAADAASAGGVFVAAGSADPFSPKAVRASAGSIFHVPLVQLKNPLSALQAAGLPVIVAEANAETSCFDFDWPENCVLALGHETRGISPEINAAATARVKIPIYGQAESLNVAMAGTVLMYAWRGDQGSR